MSLNLFVSILLLLNATGAISAETAASKDSKSELYWGKETCVVYDYRPMIQRKEKAPHLFAIELRNHNGGSLAKTYEIKGTSAKNAYSALLSDVRQFMSSGKCDRMEIFYPSEKQMDSEM